MTHEELKDIGFTPYYDKANRDINHTYVFKSNKLWLFLEKGRVLTHKGEPLGSNFTPESLKQLIEILKKSQ